MEEIITAQDITKIPLLEDREQKECFFAIEYERNFKHGTSGHLSYMLIAKLVKQLLRALYRVDTQDSATNGWRSEYNRLVTKIHEYENQLGIENTESYQ